MDETGRPPSQRERVLDSLTAFGAAQSELLRLFARGKGMHVTDAAAVVQIIEHEDAGRPLTPARLAERIGLSPGATSILLARLETAGFIDRTREHADRRIVTLRSTKAINEAADAFFEPLAKQLDAALAELTTKDLDLLLSATDRLRALVEAYAHDAEHRPHRRLHAGGA
jgi:MarR family transcriptional regulator, organic hydroperoxide resistance regulator